MRWWDGCVVLLDFFYSGSWKRASSRSHDEAICQGTSTNRGLDPYFELVEKSRTTSQAQTTASHILHTPSPMDVRLLRRPVIELLKSRSQCLLSFSTTARRPQESYRRTKQKLNIKPDASFRSSPLSPQQDHIIFNPPSSAPSVLHTPVLFIPNEDKRKQLLAKTASKHETPDKLPPIIARFKRVEIKHHLSEEDVAEIRRLRTSDPDKWTARKLGIKFNCTAYFVAMCCQVPEEKKERDREKFEAFLAKLGPKRLKARQDRHKRMALACRDGYE